VVDDRRVQVIKRLAIFKHHIRGPFALKH
jgi:hypothetical protein